jgi:hypothetical protein
MQNSGTSGTERNPLYKQQKSLKIFGSAEGSAEQVSAAPKRISAAPFEGFSRN